MTNSQQEVDESLLRSSQYQSDITGTIEKPHPDFETDKSDTGYGISKPPSENSSMLFIPLKEQVEQTAETMRAEEGELSSTSRDVFRVDQVPTDGSVETPEPGLFSNPK